MNNISKSLFLAHRAACIRMQVLDLICSAKKGHIGGCFSCADVITAVYKSEIFNLTPLDKKDQFFLSKGHCAAVLYAVLHDCGYFDKKTLMSYGENNTLLGAHSDARLVGVDVTSGSLGMSLGIAAGLALAKKINNQESRTIVLTGDGECCEGSIWEAAMFAAHHTLNRLLWIIDRNKLCVLDSTEDCTSLEPLTSKLEAFGWDVQEFDGHNFDMIIEALQKATNSQTKKPQALIAQTIKGKGISFMENRLEWHHKVPNSEEYAIACSELKKYMCNGGEHAI